jgi:hypothetical protein
MNSMRYWHCTGRKEEATFKFYESAGLIGMESKRSLVSRPPNPSIADIAKAAARPLRCRSCQTLALHP